MELWGLEERKNDKKQSKIVPDYLKGLAPEDTLGTVTNDVTDNTVVYVDPEIIGRQAAMYAISRTIDSPFVRGMLISEGAVRPESLKSWADSHKVRM